MYRQLRYCLSLLISQYLGRGWGWWDYWGLTNKLSTGRGNILNRTEKLRELGVKTSKQLDKIMPEALIDEPEREDNQENDSKE